MAMEKNCPYVAKKTTIRVYIYIYFFNVWFYSRCGVSLIHIHCYLFAENIKDKEFAICVLFIYYISIGESETACGRIPSKCISSLFHTVSLRGRFVLRKMIVGFDMQDII